MKRLAMAAGVLLVISACDGIVVIVSSGTTPTLVASPTSRTPPPRDIAFGVTVFGTVTSSHPTHVFDVIAPSGGILVVRVSWDVRSSGTQLLLRVGNTPFAGARPDWSPIVGRLPIRQGERCRLIVETASADSVSNDQFVLTTSLE